ncbi:hypothetical protein EV562_109190 [Streptomyces sp. BK208]|nr:hypothetical protein EV562_109190 [Streptomyces sp. BK208]
MYGTSGGEGGPVKDEEPVDELSQFSALLEDSAEDLYEHAPAATCPPGWTAGSRRSTPPC